jgi:hypothetical protein
MERCSENISRKTSLIRVYREDKARLMKDCRERFLAVKPEFRGMEITQAFMMKKLVDFFLE